MRFPFFNNKWSTTTLGTITKVFSGGTPSSKNKAYYNGNIPFIRSGEINKEETELFLSEDGLKNSSAKLVSKGDLLLALYGATSGEIGISKIDGAINQAILCIKSNENIGFLKYLWESHVDGILKTYLQGGQGNLSAEIFKSIKIHIPSLEEQLVLYDFFEKLEKRINTQKKIIDNLNSLINSIINHIYSKNDYNVKLSDVITQSTNRNKNGLIDYVSSVSNKYGFIKQSEQFEDRDVASDDLSNYKVVTLNDFGYNPARINVGSIARYKNTNDTVVSPMYICFKCKNNLYPEYLEYYFKSKEFKIHLLRRLEGSVRQCLTFESMQNIPFHLPNLDEQKKNAKIISALFKKIQLETSILNKLILQKDYLLSKMFI